MKNILLIGSGGLRVGQAGEFDYSGSQAIKAFKSEGHRIILINPNIATVQTDESMADKTYLLPLTLAEVTAIIETENIQLLALGFGGQTALNLGIELADSGILDKYNIQILGSPIASIKATEDRDLFKATLENKQIKTPFSKAANSLEEAVASAGIIGYPLMLRSAFSLGGLGSGKVSSEEELITKVTQALAVTPQVLLEEYLTGWKEFEYEIVRDMEGNALTICNMENLDPMGIHTGESIVIAPAQTLTNNEHQQLRDVALKCAELFGIIGECNIQFAVNPQNGDYRVIEMNPRLSRSSALASKATGYPLAFVAAKLCLGLPLYKIENSLTESTSAYFEPALDYVVVKIPRWDTHKMPAADRKIGSEMKSVGEVMGIGRSFAEALQKAVQMLNIGASCLHDYPLANDISLENEIEFATDRRIFALYKWFFAGGTVTKAHTLSHIDPWFLNGIAAIANFTKDLANFSLNYEVLLAAKQFGLSDKVIGEIHNLTENEIRELRYGYGIIPVVKQIDTVAGEMAAKSNYLYLTYHGTHHDLASSKEHICILGSGPYSIGSSVEFDWCTVNLARSLRQKGKKIIIINSNPETVSTDYDESERLYFEPLSFERVADILDFENPTATIVCAGGQIANNLAPKLAEFNYKILGTQADKVLQAENRQEFATMLNSCQINQPHWATANSLEEIRSFINTHAYPLIVRPSFVLSGSAMKVIDDDSELIAYLNKNKISTNNSAVISQFIKDGKEIEVDGVCQHGEIIFLAIAEHVENVGVHSGDATIIYPAQSLATEIMTKIKEISIKIAAKLALHGPFNMQLILKDDELLVIECNVRASRSLPFIAKVSGINLVNLIADILLDKKVVLINHTPEQIGVKCPVFSYNRFKGADPVSQVEMAATGEVACIGDNLATTFFKSWIASGQNINSNKLLIQLPEYILNKETLANLEKLLGLGWEISSYSDTYQLLTDNGIKVRHHVRDTIKPAIAKQEFGLIINIPENNYNASNNLEEYMIRRSAIDYHIPLISNAQVGKLMLDYLASE
jgi:carbamoyl-phosphate synthase large subunit